MELHKALNNFHANKVFHWTAIIITKEKKLNSLSISRLQQKQTNEINRFVWEV